jgi:glycosyltransferase involved in cell wall biosynthesis
MTSNIHYLPHQTVDKANAIIAQASLGIVSLNPGIYRYAFPSKTFTYMACGVPIIAVVEKDGELARMVEENGVGVCSHDHSANAIAIAIIHAIDNGIVAEEISKHVVSTYNATYHIDKVTSKWVRMLKGSTGT